MKLKPYLNSLKTWVSAHRLAASAIGLLALTLGFLIIVPLFHQAPAILDPQEKIGVSWIKPPGSEAAYAGNEACKGCHPHEYQLYIASPHAQTLHPVPVGALRPEFDSHQTVMDERDGILYSVRKGDGKNQVVAATASGTTWGGVKWVFGSGVEAWTYLAQHDADFLQLRITYYPIDGTWNFTPGSGPGAPVRHVLGDPFTPGQAAACFGCHSTVLVGTRERLDLDHSLLNVGCESCHGPCRSHVESMSGGAAHTQTAAVTPLRHDGTQIMQLCGTCHRIPVAVSDESAAGESQLARFPGIALPRSRCFLASNGKLSCITCHDPHESTKQQEASFESKCLNCHSEPQGIPCSHGETKGCINCHMPQEAIGRKLPLRFHNHWIRKDPYGVNGIN